MTPEDKQLLRRQAYRLAALGVIVERERSKLKKLIERGVSYDDPRVARAVERFQAAHLKWTELEKEHLKLRRKLGLEIF